MIKLLLMRLAVLCLSIFLFSCKNSPTPPGPVDSPASQVVFLPSGEAKDPCLSQDGNYIYFSSNSFSANYHIYEKKLGASSVKQITGSDSNERFPAINPVNPSTIAFCSSVNGEWDIFIIADFKREPNKWIRLSERGMDDLHPSWSADGQKLVYCSRREDEWIIKIRDLSSGALFSLEKVRGLFPKWSPTGSAIVLQRMRETGNWYSDIWIFNFEDGVVKDLRNIVQREKWAAINPSFSPDGKKIVFSRTDKLKQSKDDMADDIFMVNIDGSHPTRITYGPSSDWQPIWSSNNRIFFTSDRQGKTAIWSRTVPK